MDRVRRDIPPEDQFGTGRGQSYRPSLARDRSPPPRMDSYRARSPPPRRTDYLMDSYKADTYRAPPPRARSRSPPPRRDDFRRRSPSPPRYRDREREPPRRGGDSYRARPLSPPRREGLPRDDLFRRDPIRDERDYRDTRDTRDYRDDRDRDRAGYGGSAAGRSPPSRYRERSPLPLKRVREPSPISSRGRRTPPPAKRERLGSPPRGAGRYDDYPPSRPVSPPRRRYSPDLRDHRRVSPAPRGVTRDYRLRSRSPITRADRVDPRAVDDWRRPRSPPTEARDEYLRDESGANSAATSRRSSPPIHASRLALQQPLDDGPRSNRASPRDPSDMREPYRAGDPEPRPRNTPLRRESGYDENRSYADTRDPVPPPRDSGRDNDMQTPRAAPPTGPSAHRPSSMAPPTGPSASNTPSGPRAGVPPSGPRGAPAAPRGKGVYGSDFSPRGRGGFAVAYRGGRGGAPPVGPSGFGRGEIARQDSEFGSRAPPSGPRSSFSQTQPPAFRQSSSGGGIPTHPRGQRFENGDNIIPNAPTGPKAGRRPIDASISPGAAQRPNVHPALVDLPTYIEGGQKAEPIMDHSKLNKLEDEAEKLRKQIEDREARKKKSLREWDRITRETEVAALRTELAEQSLRELNGEAESQAAF